MLYSYVPCPPAAADIVIEPSVVPKQETFVLATVAVMIGGSVITTAGLSITEHVILAASLILTLYVPGARFRKLPDPCHVPPPFIENSYVPKPPEGFEISIEPLFAP